MKQCIALFIREISYQEVHSESSKNGSKSKTDLSNFVKCIPLLLPLLSCLSRLCSEYLGDHSQRFHGITLLLEHKTRNGQNIVSVINWGWFTETTIQSLHCALKKTLSFLRGNGLNDQLKWLQQLAKMS